MITSQFPPPPDDAFKNARQEDGLLSALRYAEFGWPVLPGPDWDGFGWRNPKSNESVPLGPLVPGEHASIDRETIIEWWNTDGALSPTVLLRASVFGVLSVPANIGRVARSLPEFGANPTPVVYRPDTDTEYYLSVAPQKTLDDNGPHRDRHVTVMRSDSWILVPPSDVKDFQYVEWRRTPESTDGRLAPFVEVIGLLIRAQNIFSRKPA